MNLDRTLLELRRKKTELEELKEKKGVPCCVVCMDADANMSFVHGLGLTTIG